MSNDNTTRPTYPARRIRPDDTWQLRLLAERFNGRELDQVDHVLDNHTRASYGALAVFAMAEQTGALRQDPAVSVTDLLGNVMHLADAIGADFEALLGTARRRYLEELHGDV